MSHNVTAKHPTEEYKQLARESVIKAFEKVKSSFQMLIRLNPEMSDAAFADRVKRRIRPIVTRDLFRYAKRHRMLEVTVRRPNPSMPDVLSRRYQEPTVYDMPSSLTNLDRLVSDIDTLIKDFISECRRLATETTSKEE